MRKALFHSDMIGSQYREMIVGIVVLLSMAILIMTESLHRGLGESGASKILYSLAKNISNVLNISYECF